MLFFASGVSKWILVPSLKAFITWLAKQFAPVKVRMSSAPPARGSTTR